METGTELMQNDFRLVIEEKSIECVDLYPNTGQMHDLPANPRFIKDERFEKLCNSIQAAPEYLNVRKLVVIPYAEAYLILCGNMRFRAAIHLGFHDVPCIVLNPKTPVEKLKEYLIKDNIAFGSDDFDLLANDFDAADLLEWGLEIPNFDEFVPEDDETNEVANTDIDLKIVFKGNFEEYEKIKEQIEMIIKPFDHIILK